MTSTTELISSANDLLASHSALLTRIRQSQRNHRRQLRALPSPPHDLLRLPFIPSPIHSPSPSPSSSPPPSPQTSNQKLPRTDLPPPKRARVARYSNYVPEEETIRNDYSQRYVDGGEWPQNWVLGAEPEHRFEEYPKQQRLLQLKKTSVNTHSFPPSYLPLSQLHTLHPCKFDVILLDPPFSSSFGWDELQELPVPTLAADPSFVFLWVGSGAGEGLERGREVLAKWGYRRCEDVVWVKTNRTCNRGPGTRGCAKTDPPTTSLLTRTKQHCLIGIRGTVRRSTDSWFVHCNVDTDVIIWEGDPSDPTRKPPETYTLIENFCLGTRRLEIFGRARSSLRRGWVTALVEGDELRVGEEMAPDLEGLGEGAIRWEKETWEVGIRELAGMDGVGAGAGTGSGGSVKAVVPSTPEIDALRPKSPVRGTSNNHHNQGGMSGGVGVGVGAATIGMGMNMGMGRGRGGVGFNNNNGSNGPQQGPNNNSVMGQNQMMVSPMMGMGVGMGMPVNHPMNVGVGVGVGAGGMDGMGGAWPGMGMGVGMGVPGVGVGVGMMGNPMGMMGMQNMQGMQGMGMGNAHPHAQGGFGFGVVGWDGHGHGQMDGMWEGGMGDGMMGMGNVNLGMGAAGHGHGHGGGMGQWGQSGYEGY